MNPFVNSQVRSLVESVRILERCVTAPSKLHSDLRMIRESLDLSESLEFDQEESPQGRLASKNLIDESQTMTVEIIRLIKTTVSLLNKLRNSNDAPFSPQWAEKTIQVLKHAEENQGSELRRRTASKIRGLYVIVDPEVTQRRPVLEVAQAAIAGGATVIQLRDKHGDSDELLPLTHDLSSACNQAGALFIINDDAALTVASRAHGLHLGQTDLPVQEARLITRTEQIVGRSNNSINEVVEAEAAGADYLAIGPIFPTTTMGKTRRASVGVETIAMIKDMVGKPVVAIGGINETNVTKVLAAGADAVCIVSAVTLAKDPEKEARKLTVKIWG